jgi:DNA-binding NtrC family response regulator
MVRYMHNYKETLVFRSQATIAIMGSAMEIKSLKIREEELIKEVLGKTHWDLEKTARLLKISLSQVKRKIKEHGIIKADGC